MTQSRGARKPTPNWIAETRFINRARGFGCPDRYIQRDSRGQTTPRIGAPSTAVARDGSRATESDSGQMSQRLRWTIDSFAQRRPRPQV
ncbi:hypothetical protein GCM10009557_60470 [Virgisporangium ochraceum]|uniref:Uncharacterized protein n=1 Tax=Virgisporangium ochraceum TaxID=65505 RepID=A0A8J4EE90_9ACTN|nr:hypothetical protein Voc01_064160 [Virgisporangium ochraceum]